MEQSEMIKAITDELEISNLAVFDCEVFKYNWLFVFEELDTGNVHLFWDKDVELFEMYLEQNQNILIGFNIKNYDNPIVNEILNGYDCESVKIISDKIVVDGMKPWDIQECMRAKSYDSCDLMDDCQLGVSLKGFEAHMGMNIVECSVDFNIDRPLTDKEKEEVEFYCRNDVKATIRMLYERRSYLATKIRLGKKKGIAPGTALYMTNAKLVAKYLGAVKKSHNDMFDYEFPTNIKYEYIDEGVIEFFKTIKAGDLLLEEKAKSFTGMIGDCEYKVGAGGIHGCNGVYNMAADADHLILNADVAQFYPSMIVQNKYLSRNVSDSDAYKRNTEERLAAKLSGDKKTANDLKLINNTTYGAQKNQYNDLYDPLMALSICLSGQLYLLELAKHLWTETGCELIQLNTDGIMFRVHKDMNDKAHEIMDEWQARTHFLLEEDNIELIIQRDVNNYLERQVNGKTKIKGGALVRGIGTVGAFKINNNATIIPKAICKWFFEGIPPEKTIEECNDIFEFQIIAKSGSKYRYTYHHKLVDGVYQYVPVQKCNRVYASNNTAFGRLYKQKDSTSTMVKIESLPDYCIVDNSNELSVDKVNKSWYIEKAKKLIQDFTQEKNQDEGDLLSMVKKVTEPKEPEIETSEIAKDMNIYNKLLKARIAFANYNIQPSGYNGFANFDYYELADIVPTANKVFANNHLFLQTTFEEEKCVGILTDTITLEKMIFEIPRVRAEETGKVKVSNPIQGLGMEITYLRRYMLYLVLDIVMADEVDATIGKGTAPKVEAAVKATPEKEPEKAEEKPVKVSKPKASKAPATATEREAIKKDITNADGACTDLQKEALKTMFGRWIELDPDAKQKVTDIVIKTEALAKCSRKEADALIAKINGVIKELEKGEAK